MNIITIDIDMENSILEFLDISYDETGYKNFDISINWNSTNW